MFVHNNITYYNLSFLLSYPEEIQEKEGIYFWIHYPDIDPDNSDFDEIKAILDKFSRVNISLSEISEQFKFKVEVSECSFPSNSRLFGLAQEKEEKLILYLQSTKQNINKFHIFFRDACLRRPFYIGKAINLRARLKQHFSSKNGILQLISTKDINFNDIWIGMQETNLSSEESISNIFEEIIQRIVKPGLTQRPG